MRPDDETPHSAPGAGLPVDSDVEVDDVTTVRRTRPVHLRVRYIAIVALGGTFGTGAREALSLAIPAVGAFPLGIFVINVAGAFVLGAALEILVRLGPDEGRRRRLRLFVGTGFLGGFTTYSTLALGAAEAITGGQAGIGILYGGLSVIAGAAAAFAGIVVSAEAHRRRSARTGRRR